MDGLSGGPQLFCPVQLCKEPKKERLNNDCLWCILVLKWLVYVCVCTCVYLDGEVSATLGGHGEDKVGNEPLTTKEMTTLQQHSRMDRVVEISDSGELSCN